MSSFAGDSGGVRGGSGGGGGLLSGRGFDRRTDGEVDHASSL